VIYINNYNIHLKYGNCSYCENKIVFHRRHSGEYLCPKCFEKNIEKIIAKTISKYRMLNPHDKIIVGLSGGKDSITLLYNLMIIQEKLYDPEPLIALSIDEGIKDYRNNSLEVAILFCKQHKIEHRIISFKEITEKTLDEIIEIKRNSLKYRYACNYCALLRRRLLNDGARELGGDVLALGHNLTDISETFVMNILFKRFHLIANQYMMKNQDSEINKFFIKKIFPLMRIPEEEIFMYVNIKKLNYYSSHCPYREIDPIIRKRVLDFIQTIKKESPEIEFNLLNGFLELSEILHNQGEKKNFNSCENCGYPTVNKNFCSYCNFIKELI
jgi:uncharacterized protein (TIGR00269 family)